MGIKTILNRKLFFKLIIIFISLVIFVGILEIAARINISRKKLTVSSSFEINDIDLSYRLKPGYKSAKFNINSIGIRGKDIDPENKKKKYRIIAVGNSCVFNTQVSSDEFTFEVQLEKMLGPQFEVLNGGVPGYSSYQSFGFYKKFLHKLKPDLIICYTGWNDMSYRRNIIKNSQKAPTIFNKISRYMSDKFYVVNYLRIFTVNMIVKYHEWKQKAVKENADNIDKMKLIKKSALTFKENLMGLDNICRDNNIKILYLTLPTFLRAGYKPGKNMDLLWSSGFSLEEMLELIEVFNKQIKDVAGNDTRLLDTYSLFNNMSIEKVLTFFHENDYVHLNDTGNNYLAGLLLNKIKKLKSSK